MDQHWTPCFSARKVLLCIAWTIADPSERSLQDTWTLISWPNSLRTHLSHKVEENELGITQTQVASCDLSTSNVRSQKEPPRNVCLDGLTSVSFLFLLAFRPSVPRTQCCCDLPQRLYLCPQDQYLKVWLPVVLQPDKIGFSKIAKAGYCKVSCFSKKYAIRILGLGLYPIP